MKPYRLVKFDVEETLAKTQCPYREHIKVFSASCRMACPHYRGTSGKRVKCGFGIDDK